MRNADDYKKLIEGYSFSLNLLKLYDKKMYDRIIKTKNLLNKHGAKFADLVRSLKIDFINENDEKEAGEAKSLIIDKGLYKEVFALSYSPLNEYIFAMLYEKHSVLGVKKIFVEIIPRTLDDIKQYTICDVFRISIVDEKNEVKKVYNFIAGIAEDCLMVLKKDVDKPKSVKPGLEIPLDELDEVVEDLSNMF